MELTSQLAAQELLRRRKVRLSLTEWGRHKGFEPAKHHLLIINEIESFLESDDEVLLLFRTSRLSKKHLCLYFTAVVVPGESLYKEHLGSDTLCRVCRKVGTPCPQRYCK